MADISFASLRPSPPSPATISSCLSWAGTDRGWDKRRSPVCQPPGAGFCSNKSRAACERVESVARLFHGVECIRQTVKNLIVARIGGGWFGRVELYLQCFAKIFGTSCEWI